MHAATALAGSGPAFFLYLTEAMARAGVDLGLDPSVARKLAHGGLLGAAVLAEDTTLSLATMREQITSPNGTTEAGLMEMKAKKLDSAIEETVKVTSARSQAMAREKKVIILLDEPELVIYSRTTHTLGKGPILWESRR